MSADEVNVNDADHFPRVSVRIPSYNHEKYVAECLQSVLDQTFQDFEIVVTDDGSTDRTVEVVRSFADPRIHLDVFLENEGCNVAIANCGRRARGEYVANLCSDDAWEPGKLARQVRYLDEHPHVDAVFTQVILVDETGEPFQDHAHPYDSIFEYENHSREQWLRRFFLMGNCLCIPSVMIRRSVYADLNFQDLRLASLGDFDLWVRFVLEHDLYILPERLTRFRVRANNENASGSTPENEIRSHFEYKQIMRHFLAITSPERLLAIFPECVQYGQPTIETIPYFLARRAIDTEESFRKLWGLEVLFNLMSDPGLAEILQQRLGFRYKDFHQLLTVNDSFGLRCKRQIRQENQNLQIILAELQQCTANNETVRQINTGLHEENVRLQMLADERKAELSTLRQTVSWRLTQPLRAMRALTCKRGREPN